MWLPFWASVFPIDEMKGFPKRLSSIFPNRRPIPVSLSSMGTAIAGDAESASGVCACTQVLILSGGLRGPQSSGRCQRFWASELLLDPLPHSTPGAGPRVGLGEALLPLSPFSQLSQASFQPCRPHSKNYRMSWKGGCIVRLHQPLPPDSPSWLSECVSLSVFEAHVRGKKKRPVFISWLCPLAPGALAAIRGQQGTLVGPPPDRAPNPKATNGKSRECNPMTGFLA